MTEDTEYDIFVRPNTPPDSPLREKFVPKELSHLRHVPPAPGMESPWQEEESTLLQAAASPTLPAGFQQSMRPASKKPKIPYKPLRLDAFPASPPRYKGAMPEVQTTDTDRFYEETEIKVPSTCSCLNTLPENAGRAPSTAEPYFHRHETVYKRFSDGEAVEIMTSTCEIASRVPSHKVMNEDDGEQDDNGNQQEVGANGTRDNKTEESAPEDDVQFAGLFV